MSYFNQILLDVHPDFADMAAVDRAAELARRANAGVKVVHVVEDYPEDMREWWNVRNPLKLHNRIVHDRQSFVDGIVDRVKGAGVERVESMLRWGREFLEITREVLRNRQELVVTTARRQNPLARRLGCTCSMGLCRYTPSTVWVTRKRVGSARGVVASLGGANGHIKGEGLNAKILKTAANMARVEGSELHVAHALSLSGAKRTNTESPGTSPAKQLAELRGQIKAMCEAVLGDLSITVTDDRIHLPVGAPTTVIPQLARQQGLDPIVMGTHARDGIPGLLMGNTVEKMMPRVDCGVMVVKPDDFVSLVAREEELGQPPALAC